MRVACADIPQLSLQLLRRARPEWSEGPLAVVEEDHPQAKILAADRRAWARKVRIGMRYGAALHLAPDLNAAPVSEARIEEAVEELASALLDHTPRVEPDRAQPGLFWLDPTGLGELFGPMERWAKGLSEALRRAQLTHAVVVGFRRYLTWAVARTRRGPFVIESPKEELALASRAPLSVLAFPPPLIEALELLSVRRLGDFLALPRAELSVRFGPEARDLHALFSGDRDPPFTPHLEDEPLRVEAELEPPDDDRHRLLFCIKGALHALLLALAGRQQALFALTLHLGLEGGGLEGGLEGGKTVTEVIRPARATRDSKSLLELVRLRLEGLSLPDRVAHLALEAEGERLDGAQLSLFGSGHRRDPGAAAEGLARVRAALGAEAVVRAELRDAWLPERAFDWVPALEVESPRPRLRDPEAPLTLVRRVLPRPSPLAVDSEGRPCLEPPIVRMSGPYRVQGGWWVREAVRDYFYAEREDGALLWIFHDRARRAWFLHGRVD